MAFTVNDVLISVETTIDGAYIIYDVVPVDHGKSLFEKLAGTILRCGGLLSLLDFPFPGASFASLKWGTSGLAIEYGQYQKWIAGENEGTAGTLLSGSVSRFVGTAPQTVCVTPFNKIGVMCLEKHELLQWMVAQFEAKHP